MSSSGCNATIGFGSHLASHRASHPASLLASHLASHLAWHLASALAPTLALLLALASAGLAGAEEPSCRHPEAQAAPLAGTPEAALARGNALMGTGDPEHALAEYLDAEFRAGIEGKPRLALLASANAARAAIEAGRLEGVEARLEKVVAAASGAGDDLDATLRATLLIHVARSWASWPASAPGARAAPRRAVELLAQAGAQAERAGDARLQSYADGWMGELYEKAGRLDDARVLTRRALLLASREQAADALYRWYWQLGRIERAAGDDAAAIQAYRKAVATVDVVRGALALGPVEGALAFRSEVVPVYMGLVDLLLQAATATGSESERQTLLAEARDTLEAEKTAELRDHFRDECLASQRKATPDSVPGAVVYYPVMLDDRVELIVGRQGRLSLFRAPVRPEALTEQIRALRLLLTKRTTRQYLRPAQQLHAWLVTPIEPVLAEPGVEALVVVPSGALRSIPFAALHDPATNRFLIERLPVATVPGLTLTDPRPIDREQVRSLVAGISQEIFGFDALEHVEGELDTVLARFPGTKLVNEAYTSEALEQSLAGQPVGIVHIASHGEFKADASRSFLLAWDGEIAMERVGSMVGRTRFRTRQPLELLTLSACQTAAGDDRAVLGLAGVALQAGARSALASLWSVDDEATSMLVAEFYAQLAQPGVSRAEALRRAQRALIADPRFAHPASWAAFLIISSWL